MGNLGTLLVDLRFFLVNLHLNGGFSVRGLDSVGDRQRFVSLSLSLRIETFVSITVYSYTVILLSWHNAGLKPKSSAHDTLGIVLAWVLLGVYKHCTVFFLEYPWPTSSESNGTVLPCRKFQ